VIRMLVDCGVDPALIVGKGNAYRGMLPKSKAYDMLESMEKNNIKEKNYRWEVKFPPEMRCLNEYCI